MKTQLPSRLFAEVFTKGKLDNLLEKQEITTDNVTLFCADENITKATIKRLQELGFEVLEVNEISISIAGPPSLYEKVFKTAIMTQERPSTKGGKTSRTYHGVLHNEEMTDLIPMDNIDFAHLIEGISINQPIEYHASIIPPNSGYFHLSVPGDVSVALNADHAHRLGYTGKGQHIVMVDSGHYVHPYFTSRGYRLNPVVLGPGATRPLHDESGHGTGESANVFAIAPDVSFQMVKMSAVNAIGAFKRAMALSPTVISCSWGYSINDIRHYNTTLKILAANVALSGSSWYYCCFFCG